MFVVEVQFVDNGLHHAFGVVCIVDGKVAVIPQVMGLAAQDAGKNAMEGADIQIAGFVIAQDLLDPCLHLLSRLIGEGYGQYARAGNPVHFHEVRHAMRDDARLAAAGASQQ